MNSYKRVDIGVGVFMLTALVALLFLSLKVANTGWVTREPMYHVYATFENISGLKTHSPVTIGGVVVGEITAITLDANNYLPRVQIAIAKRYNNLPATSRIMSNTAGLLGEKYLAIVPGFVDSSTAILQAGDTIEDTQSSIVLEELIGRLIRSRLNSN